MKGKKKRNVRSLDDILGPKPETREDACVRDAAIVLEKREAEGDKPGYTAVRLSVSSELPYLKWCWDEEVKDYVRGYEVLGHREGEINFSRMKDGLVIQDGHYGRQIGIMDKPEVKDGKLCGDVRFGHSQEAQDCKADAIDGIRKNMSVGYFIDELKREGVAEDGFPIFRATKWTPYEASFVNTPADTSVGVGRSVKPTADKPSATRKEIQIMEKPNETKAAFEPSQVVECFKLAKNANVEHAEVEELIKSGKSFDEVRSVLEGKLDAYVKELAAKANKPEMPKPGAKAAIDEETEVQVRKRYSLTNVIRALAGEKVDIGFEREISQEVAKASGRAAQGILIPDFVRSTEGQETLARPEHGVIEGLGGNVSALIENKLLAGNFIEALRDALVLREKCGVQVLTGLVGNITIPKESAIPQAAWITAEYGDASKTNPTYGQIQATPHSCGAYIDITRQALMQSSLDLQMLAQKGLLYAMAYALEKAMIQGTDTNGQPAGLIGQIPVAATKAWGNAPTFDKLVELMAIAKKANSYNPSWRFLGDTDVWHKLATTRDYEKLEKGADGIAAVGGRDRLLNIDTDKVIGREFVESHLMEAKKLVFGNFSDLICCLWSGTDLIVDQYSQSTKGALRIVTLQDSDVVVRRPESFALATGVHA